MSARYLIPGTQAPLHNVVFAAFGVGGYNALDTTGEHPLDNRMLDCTDYIKTLYNASPGPLTIHVNNDLVGGVINDPAPQILKYLILRTLDGKVNLINENQDFTIPKPMPWPPQ